MSIATHVRIERARLLEDVADRNDAALPTIDAAAFADMVDAAITACVRPGAVARRLRQDVPTVNAWAKGAAIPHPTMMRVIPLEVARACRLLACELRATGIAAMAEAA